MTKTIMMLAIAIAFVAGSIGTGTVSYAQQGGQGNSLIVDALNNIVSAISGIDPDVTVNVPPAEVQIVGIEGPQGPQGVGCSIVGTFVKCGDLGSDVQGPQGIQGLPGAAGEMGPSGESFTQIIKNVWVVVRYSTSKKDKNSIEIVKGTFSWFTTCP